jgi:hypothetical protein
MIDLVAACFAARFATLTAGTPVAQGPGIDIDLPPGAYELRIVGGSVSISNGTPIGVSDVRVVEIAPLRFVSTGRIRLAASGATAALAWVMPLRPASAR